MLHISPRRLNSKLLFGTESFVGDGFGITHSQIQVDTQITSLGFLHLAKKTSTG